jgi:hypothetical protein
MDLNKYRYLIFSSHKSSTQSLKSIFLKNGYNSIHCHQLFQLEYIFKNTKISNEIFIDSLKKYKDTGVKIKIVSIIRNPIDRLPSSFFQSYHNDEIDFLKKKVNETTVNSKNSEQLFDFFQERIKKNDLRGKDESIDELSNIFNINLIDRLEKKDGYYYFNHDLFEIFVLNFKEVIGSNNLEYLNKVLKIDLNIKTRQNLSNNKSYYNKYIILKQRIPTELNNLIKTQYNNFYFNAFQ